MRIGALPLRFYVLTQPWVKTLVTHAFRARSKAFIAISASSVLMFKMLAFGILFLATVTHGPLQAAVDSSVANKLTNPKVQLLLKRIGLQYQRTDEIILSEVAVASESVVRIPVGEELLLSLSVDKIALSEVFAFKSAEDAQLGLMGLLELLDFPIEVDLEQRRAEGWFISEDRHFLLTWPEELSSETAPAQVIINGQSSVISSQSLRSESDDLYIDADILSDWFGIGMEFDFVDLTLKLHPETPLPVQRRWARKNRKSSTRSTYSNIAVLPWRESTYQAYSHPLVDVQLYGSTSNNGLVGGYSVLGSQDLAYLNAEYYMGGNDADIISDLRLKLTKESTKADLLGPLRATQYQLGDITPVNAGIGNTGGLSRGGRFSNYDIGRVVDHDKINLNGDIQPGWDIELYRNGLFIASQLSLKNGRYEFNDIELLFGDNQFEMIFYGPQGQVETKSKQVFVNSNALTSKESNYGVSVTEVGKSLFGISGLGKVGHQGWLVSGLYQQGVTDWLSFSLGHASMLAKDGDDKQSYSLGSNMSLFDNLLLQASYEIEPDAVQQGLFSARTRIGDHSLGLRYNWRQTNLPDNILQDSETNQYDLNLSGRLFADSALPLSYQTNWNHFLSNTGTRRDSVTQQVTFNSYGMLVNNKLSWYQSVSQLDENERITGNLRLQRSFGRVSTRFSAGYRLSPESELTILSFDFYIPITSQLQSELSLDFFPITDKYNTELGLTWHEEKYSLNSNINYDDDGDWSIAVNYRFSFGYEPITSQFFTSRHSLANQGSMMVRVFEDENANGVFDEGEPIVEGAKVKGLQSHRQALSNENGVAMLQGMQNNLTTDIVLDRDSFDDPFLLPAIPGISITPRKGSIEVMDFPVVTASELEGTVYVKNAMGTEKPAAYVTVNLVDDNDKLIATAETEFDGYYLFTDLLPGHYRASIDSSYISRKKLHGADELELSFKASGDIINGADFTLDQIQFAKGYVVNLGDFHSLDILKTYWGIVRRNPDNVLTYEAFYVFNEANEKYMLNVAFYKESVQAQNSCQSLAAAGLYCNVEAFEFEL